jgi:hypothetical protein
MEVSFVKKDAGADAPVVEMVTTVAGSAPVVEAIPVAEIVSPVPTNLAMVPVASAPIAVRQPEQPPFYDDENIGFEDIILPRLNIVQKVGELSNVFAGGEVIYNNSLPIYTPPILKDGAIVKPGTKPLNITILGFRKKQFVEKVIGGAMGALCNTEEEVAKLGGTLDFKENEAKVKAGIPSKLFQRLATALLLIEKPEHLVDADHIQFAHECEGRFYALALWSMKGTSYTGAAKTFFTARKMGHLKDRVIDGVKVRGHYHDYSWNLGTKLETYGANFAYIPVLTNGTKNSPAFMVFVADVLGMGR